MMKKLTVSIYVLMASMALSGFVQADSVKVKNRSGIDVVVETFNGDDSVCLAHYDTWPVSAGEDKTLSCNFGSTTQCKLLVSDAADNQNPTLCSSSLTTRTCGSSNVVYVQDSQTLIIHGDGCWFATADYPGYFAGYIYGTNSDANDKCLQAQTDSFANGVDVHLWDKCINGGPQKNRQWKYELATGYIRNVDDPSYCLHKQTNGFTVGDNIHMWKCDDGGAENKQWEYNVNGQNLIRSKANPNFCIFRGGANVGDAIHLWSCDPNNNSDQNGRWNITWGGSG